MKALQNRRLQTDVLLFLILFFLPFFLYNACSSSIYTLQIRFLYSGVTMYLHTEFRILKKKKKKKLEVTFRVTFLKNKPAVRFAF